MTGISTLGQIMRQTSILTEQQTLLNDLTTQLSTQKKTQKFTGLDNDVLTIQRSRTQINVLENYMTNISNADRRLELTLNAVEEFQSQARVLLDFIGNLSQESEHQNGDVVYYDDPGTPDVIENIPVGMTSGDMDADFTNLTESAGDLYDIFTNLLNTKDKSRYLMAGAETTTQPIADSTSLDAAISNLLTDWKDETITTDDLIADLLDGTTADGNSDAITDTIIGFSSVLSSGSAKNVYARVDDRTEIDMTVKANADPFRDILVAAAYFKNPDLTPIADVVDPDTLTVLQQGAPGADTEEQKENFFSVLKSFATTINNAIDDIDAIRYDLENARARISEIKGFHESEQNLLLETVSDIEDVDLNEVALSINTLAVQLDASYSITARTQELSLVYFI